MSAVPRVLAAVFVTGCLAAAVQAAAPPELTASLARLDQYLATSTTPANAAKWRNYLQLQGLQSQISANSSPDWTVLQTAWTRFHGTAPGLDRSPFVEVRFALDSWLNSLPTPSSGDLARALRGAQQQGYQPLGGLASSQSEARQALKALQAYLSTQQTGAGWTKFLQLDQINAALSAAQPAPATLRALQPRFVAGHPGLEIAPFIQAREALAAYVDRLEITSQADAAAKYADALETVAAATEAKAASNNMPADMTADLSAALAWLEQSGQVPHVVTAARRAHSQPNLLLSVSQNLLAARIDRPVQQTAPVRDMILGTDIYGTGTTTGQLRVDLVPASQQWLVDFLLGGQVQTTTTGYNGPAILYSNGTTTFSARKRLEIGPEGIRAAPAQTSAVTDSTLTGVGSSLNFRPLAKMVQKIARKKAGQQMGQAESIAARHAEERISRQLDAQVAEQLRTANANYAELFRSPLLQVGAFPQDVQFSTTDDALHLIAACAERGTLAAPGPAPAIPHAGVLSVQVHESLVNNLGRHLAGRTLDESAFKSKLEEKFKKLPENWEEPAPEKRTLTFADQDPVALKLADGKVDFTLRAKHFTRGEKNFEAMNIHMVYEIQLQEHGVKLIRQGKLDVLPPGYTGSPDDLPLGQALLSKLLQKTFDKMFPEVVETKGLDLQDAWQRVGKLTPVHVEVAQGWFSAVWDRQTVPRVAARPSTQPATRIATQPPAAPAKAAK